MKKIIILICSVIILLSCDSNNQKEDNFLDTKKQFYKLEKGIETRIYHDMKYIADEYDYINGLVEKFQDIEGNIYSVEDLDGDTERRMLVKKNGKGFLEKDLKVANKYLFQTRTVLGKPAFTFLDQEKGRTVWYNGEFLNEKYSFDETESPFEIDGKLAFVAKKDGKSFIILDGKKISKDFDDIDTLILGLTNYFEPKVYNGKDLYFIGKNNGIYELVHINLKSK